MQKQRTWVYLAVLVTLLASCRSVNEPEPSTVPTSSATPAPESTSTATNTTQPTATQTATASIRLPGYTTTYLEINRNGKQYSIFLGYDIGEAWFYATPDPGSVSDYADDDISQISSATLQRYGDFDSDGETEYFVESFARGANVTIRLQAFDYDPAADEYRAFNELYFRASCYDGLEDIESDGSPEVIAKDEDFHYASGGGGADSIFSPLMIYRYNGQEFIDVTDQYPERIEEDAEHWLEAIDTDAWGQGQVSTIYAAYLADMYRLGKQEEGVAVYNERCADYLAPYILSENPESTFSCDENLTLIQEALIESGYE